MAKRRAEPEELGGRALQLIRHLLSSGGRISGRPLALFRKDAPPVRESRQAGMCACARPQAHLLQTLFPGRSFRSPGPETLDRLEDRQLEHVRQVCNPPRKLQGFRTWIIIMDARGKEPDLVFLSFVEVPPPAQQRSVMRLKHAQPFLGGKIEGGREAEKIMIIHDGGLFRIGRGGVRCGLRCFSDDLRP